MSKVKNVGRSWEVVVHTFNSSAQEAEVGDL